jgi:hypothetical protein
MGSIKEELFIRVCQECKEFIITPISDTKCKDADMKCTGFKEVCNVCYKNGKTLY